MCCKRIWIREDLLYYLAQSPAALKMTETDSEEKMDVESKEADAQEKKEVETPTKDDPQDDDDDDDSEDSVPIKKLAASKKRGKGPPATKVTLGRKKTTPVQSPPEDHNLDFEEEGDQKGKSRATFCRMI